MARASRTAEPDEPSARDRLAALHLRAPVDGWVPDPPLDPADPPDPALLPGYLAVDPLPIGAEPGSPHLAAPDLGELARAWAIDRSPPWSHHMLARVGIRALAGALTVVLAVVVGVVVLVHRHSASAAAYSAPPAATSPEPDPATSSAPDAAADGSSIVVDVGGRVRKPGLVTLPAGARVVDAIAAAGGPLRHNELARLDLAARVSDGQLLLVGVASDPAGADQSGPDPSDPSAPAAPVGLNSATLEELETLPGVGPVTAQKIVDWRNAHNGFTSVVQLQQVPGIGPARYAELSPLVTP